MPYRTLNMFFTIGEVGEPIITPSACLINIKLIAKYVDLRYSSFSILISFRIRGHR